MTTLAVMCSAGEEGEETLVCSTIESPKEWKEEDVSVWGDRRTR